MFILKTGHQLGVYVPLRALFLVSPINTDPLFGAVESVSLTKAINFNNRSEREKSITQGGYLDTYRDYRLPSLNFGKNAEVLRNIPGHHPKNQ